MLLLLPGLLMIIRIRQDNNVLRVDCRTGNLAVELHRRMSIGRLSPYPDHLHLHNLSPVQRLNRTASKDLHLLHFPRLTI